MYNGEHSVTFVDGNSKWNTWNTWKLIPMERPVFDPPEPNFSEIEIPGGNGALMINDALSGIITYKTRSGSFDFIVPPEYCEFFSTYSEIMQCIHGKKVRIILEDDPGYFYEGMCKVSGFSNDKMYSSISIDCKVQPYKRNIQGTTEEWIWDTFNFENGVISQMVNAAVKGSRTFDIVATPMPVVPEIETDAEGMTMRIRKPDGGDMCGEQALKKGKNRIMETMICGTEGDIFHIDITGNGNVTIDYRGGRM